MRLIFLILTMVICMSNTHGAATAAHRARVENPTFSDILSGCTTHMKVALASNKSTTFLSAQEALRDGLRFVARGEQPPTRKSPSGTKVWRIASAAPVTKRDPQVIANFFNTAAYVAIYTQKYTHPEGTSVADWYVQFIQNLLPQEESSPAVATQSAQARYLFAKAITRFKGTGLDDARSKAAFLESFAAHVNAGFQKNTSFLLDLTAKSGFEYPKVKIKNRKTFEHLLGTERALTISPQFMDVVEGDETVKREVLTLLARGERPCVIGYSQWSGSASSQTTHNGVITSSSRSASQGASLTVLLGRQQFTVTGDPEVITSINEHITGRRGIGPIGALPAGDFMRICVRDNPPLGGSVVNTSPFSEFASIFSDFAF